MLDLDHLARQTLGDRVLQRDVLELFVAQMASEMERLQNEPDSRARSEVAHKIIGSARAIGAFGAAQAAERVESAKGTAKVEVAELGEALDKVCAFIQTHLAK